jgi:hypothetical protein
MAGKFLLLKWTLLIVFLFLWFSFSFHHLSAVISTYPKNFKVREDESTWDKTPTIPQVTFHRPIFSWFQNPQSLQYLFSLIRPLFSCVDLYFVPTAFLDIRWSNPFILIQQHSFSIALFFVNSMLFISVGHWSEDIRQSHFPILGRMFRIQQSPCLGLFPRYFIFFIFSDLPLEEMYLRSVLVLCIWPRRVLLRHSTVDSRLWYVHPKVFLSLTSIMKRFVLISPILYLLNIFFSSFSVIITFITNTMVLKLRSIVNVKCITTLQIIKIRYEFDKIL